MKEALAASGEKEINTWLNREKGQDDRTISQEKTYLGLRSVDVPKKEGT